MAVPSSDSLTEHGTIPRAKDDFFAHSIGSGTPSSVGATPSSGLAILVCGMASKKKKTSSGINHLASLPHDVLRQNSGPVLHGANMASPHSWRCAKSRLAPLKMHAGNHHAATEKRKL